MSYLSCSSCVLFVPFSFSTLVFLISFLIFIFHLLSLFIYLFLFGFFKKNIVLVFFFLLLTYSDEFRSVIAFVIYFCFSLSSFSLYVCFVDGLW